MDGRDAPPALEHSSPPARPWQPRGPSPSVTTSHHQCRG
nr:hypothetical protein RVX_2082 [Nitratidesulfovibrio sp. HK-II]